MTTVSTFAILSIALISALVPQARPDFSGTWTLGHPAGIRPGEIEGRGNRSDGQLRVGISPASLVIAQGEDRLRMEEHRTAGVRLTIREYGLKGQPVKNPVILGPKHEPFQAEVTSVWQENKLVSTIVVAVPGEPEARRYTETLLIGPEGVLAVRIQRVGSADTRTLFYQKSK
jgi:hypothetical protein